MWLSLRCKRFLVYTVSVVFTCTWKHGTTRIQVNPSLNPRLNPRLNPVWIQPNTSESHTKLIIDKCHLLRQFFTVTSDSGTLWLLVLWYFTSFYHKSGSDHPSMRYVDFRDEVLGGEIRILKFWNFGSVSGVEVPQIGSKSHGVRK